MSISNKTYKRLIANKIRASRTGEPETSADGSIPTKPTVDIPIPQKEAVVLKQCLSWLRRRCLADRMNVGLMDTAGGRKARFGIKGAGDVICCHKGIHIEVECKNGKGGRLSIHQQDRKKDVESNGGVYLIVHDLIELVDIWERLEL